MGGGLLQLVAYGAQDAYITGNPQITFWKGLFKRHTNFAMEPFRINFTGQPSWGTKQTAIVGRHADLLYSTYIEVVLPPTDSEDHDYSANQPYKSGAATDAEKKSNKLSPWLTTGGYDGFNLIHYAELDVGGQIVDRQYGEFLNLWSQLTLQGGQAASLFAMCGSLSVPFSTPSCTSPDNTSGRQVLPYVFYIPLYFFFTRNPGAALPLIALQYHEVKINVFWNDPQKIAADYTRVQYLPPPTQASLYIDYIYLDTEERRRMAQQSHEYLIEQTQYNEDKGIVGPNVRIDLTFNHPVKELIWVVQPTFYTDCRLAKAAGLVSLLPFTYDTAPVYEQFLQINGQDRMDRRYGDYFNKVQPYQHHTGSFSDRAVLSISNKVFGGNWYQQTLDTETPFLSTYSGAYVYSFALRPEEHQPSGTCNFSRIDTATIVMTLVGDIYVNKVPDSSNWNVRAYAINYNVLRIMSGMGGLAFSN